MVALLGELRRERNGAVADAMRCYGAPYGLNYGVSLPTLRKLARAETPDHDFARYLYLQEVRELRLAALHIARPESLTPDEFPAWAAGIVNSITLRGKVLPVGGIKEKILAAKRAGIKHIPFFYPDKRGIVHLHPTEIVSESISINPVCITL